LPEIKYIHYICFLTFGWLIYRTVTGFSNKKIKITEELKMLLVYICLLVIGRIVYFPWHHVDGHIGGLIFDIKKIIPIRHNLIPIVRLFEKYDGWQMNIIGNITMFIPVGIVWPICYKKLDTYAKAVIAGGGVSLFIEISQILFYERASDIDDLILNTTGVAIGAAIYFIIRANTNKSKSRSEVE